MRVVVVGGGFAGLAAAVSLQERRHEVTLLERRGVLGGRATSFHDAQTAEDVDNGTHLMVGAYTETQDLIRRAGAEDLLLIQDDLRIDYVDEKGFSALKCPPLPAPLHLLFGLLSLRLPMRVRLEALRFGLAVSLGPRPDGLTLAEYLKKTGQGEASRKLLWDPLATAILNETPERAAAVLFHRVYREAFLTSRKASRLLFLRCGWARLHDRIAAYLENRGASVKRRALVEGVCLEDGRVVGVDVLQSPEAREDIQKGKPARRERIPADVVILAVPWAAVPPLLPEAQRSQPPFSALAQLRSSPIVSVDLWLDRVVLDRIMVGLRGCEAEWVFDKGRLFGRSGPPQHLSFIFSAAYRSGVRKNAELVSMTEGALRRFFPAMAGASLVRSLVLREPDATFSSDPAAEALRPSVETPVPGLLLAGDWTKTGLPATIEGAVRSGREAARAVS